MNFSFISVVTVLNSKEEVDRVGEFLPDLSKLLKENFNDFEIILVNNTSDDTVSIRIEQFGEPIKNSIYLIHLSKTIDQNNAMVAGLDQANGDYIVLLETDFYSLPEVILKLYARTRENFDIVYLRSGRRTSGFLRQVLLKLFYFILKKYSGLTIDEKAYDSRIISRRAVNSILKLRENLRYMKAIYALVGYRTSSIELDVSVHKKHPRLSVEIKTAVNAITSFTDFLGRLLLWIFMGSILLFLGVTSNALSVKLLGHDIFGFPQKEVTGWTFLVILISLTFAILCMILYIMSVYLANIYREIKQRPLYIIESIKRF